MWSVRSHLEAALAACWQQAIAGQLSTSPLPPELDGLHEQVGLRRVASDVGIVYSSAIALRLSAQTGQPAEQLADGLIQSWQQSSADSAAWADSTARVEWGGLVQIRVGDRTLARWLQQFSSPSPLITLVPTLPGAASDPTPGAASDPTPGTASDPTGDRRSAASLPDANAGCLSQANRFAMQAAHARCVSLLALAEWVGLIRCGPQGAIAEPALLPWLQDEQTLRVGQPAERDLIGQLLNCVDAISPQLTAAQAAPLALALSRRFYQFDAACRIFGAVAAAAPRTSQARLGLVRATQQTLGYLLEKHLAIAALSAL